MTVPEIRSSLTDRFRALPYRSTTVGGVTVGGVTIEDALHNEKRFGVMAEIGDFNRHYPELAIRAGEVVHDA